MHLALPVPRDRRGLCYFALGAEISFFSDRLMFTLPRRNSKSTPSFFSFCNPRPDRKSRTGIEAYRPKRETVLQHDRKRIGNN